MKIINSSKHFSSISSMTNCKNSLKTSSSSVSLVLTNLAFKTIRPWLGQQVFHFFFHFHFFIVHPKSPLLENIASSNHLGLLANTNTSPVTDESLGLKHVSQSLFLLVLWKGYKNHDQHNIYYEDKWYQKSIIFH